MPGQVRFVENEAGDVVIRPVNRPSETRGDLATSKADEGEQTATEMIREERERDTEELDKNHEQSDADE